MIEEFLNAWKLSSETTTSPSTTGLLQNEKDLRGLFLFTNIDGEKHWVLGNASSDALRLFRLTGVNTSISPSLSLDKIVKISLQQQYKPDNSQTTITFQKKQKTQK